MPQQLPCRQNQSLRRRIHRYVCWAFDDVEAFEVNPHGMSGVRDFPVSERIRREQIAELVVPPRVRNAKDRDERSPNYNYSRPHR